QIKGFAIVNAFSMSIMLTTPFVMVMLTLVVYFNGDGSFGPDVVFTAVSLLLVIRFPLMMLPMAVASWVQGKISLGRMQKFFELEELHPKDREWTNRGGNGEGAGTVSIAGTFVWTPVDDEDGDDAAGAAGGKQKEVAAAAAAGKGATQDGKGEGGGLDAEKKAVKMATVGSGKSSLVSAILGEMTKVDGRICIDGSVAYVAQTAWIINASLKDNVLMGRPFDEGRYREVLQVCDMEQDLLQLPAGDKTEIGEKGINLSGGQKQRVSIARAAYAN
ncbi:unnamed protein product, partial [Hapterophycus canaliculatus]